MIRLSKRNVNRLALIALIAAPIVYLFGSLFASLNGAHAAFPFAADYEVPVSSRVVSFNQLVNSSSASGNVISFDDGVYKTASISTTTTFSVLNSAFDIVSGHKYIATYSVLNSSSNSSLLIYDNTYSVYRNDFVSGVVYTAVSDSNISVNLRYYDVNRSLSFRFIVTDLTLAYGSGNEPSSSQFYLDFPDIYYPYETGKNVVFDVYGQPDNYQFLFNQFFGKSNFLSQWGLNAISDDPLGFAPIGNFYQWLDVNLLHLSNSQIGLMAYGYSYYLAHVLLFDLFFYTCTFFISWLFGLFDKFGGSGL